MNCDKIEELLNAYVDQQAGPGEQAQVALHLAECPACLRQARWLSAAKAAIAAVPFPDCPPDLGRGILARMRDQSASALPWYRRGAVFWKGAAFAAAAGVLAVTRLALTPSEELALDEALAAHGEYSLTLPGACREELYANWSAHLAKGAGDGL